VVEYRDPVSIKSGERFIRSCLGRVEAALVERYSPWLSEDYYIILAIIDTSCTHPNYLLARR
jgi:hypothetical protein